jgi:hypothetical protein
MNKEINRTTRTQVLNSLRGRYHEAKRPDKSKRLDEFVALTGYHRKHALRLLAKASTEHSKPKGRRIYDEAVRQALTILWETSDRLCGKRLKAILPTLLESLQEHGYLSVLSKERSSLD